MFYFFGGDADGGVRGPDVQWPSVNAVGVISRNNFVPFLGDPFLDKRVFEDMQIAWDLDVFHSAMANKQVMRSSSGLKNFHRNLLEQLQNNGIVNN